MYKTPALPVSKTIEDWFALAQDIADIEAVDARRLCMGKRLL